jgi:hypothetical protein
LNEKSNPKLVGAVQVSSARSTPAVASTLVTEVLACAENPLPSPKENKIISAIKANLLRNQEIGFSERFWLGVLIKAIL